MKKEEAEKKWCPMAAEHSCYDEYTGTRCITDRCMWWVLEFKEDLNKPETWEGRCGAVLR